MTAVEKPKTLAEILAWLDAVDQGLIATTPEDQERVGALLVAKVDNTVEVDQELERDEIRLREAAAKLLKGAQQIAARRERMAEYMGFHMQANGFKQLPGDNWKLKLNTGLSAEPKRKKPTLDDFKSTPDFVRIKYEWDRTALKKALEALDPDAMRLADLVPSASASYEVYKGRLLSE